MNVAERHEYMKEYHRQWYQKNKHKQRGYVVKNRDKFPVKACLYRKAMRMRKVNKLVSKLSGKKFPFIALDQLVALYERQGGRCALTGRKLLLFSTSTNLDAISVDRIKNEPGYRLKNLRLVINQANSAKGCGTDAELIKFCQDVLKTTKKKAVRSGVLARV